MEMVDQLVRRRTQQFESNCVNGHAGQNGHAVGANGALPGMAPGSAPQPVSAARKRMWLWLTNGSLALALRYLVQVSVRQVKI